MKATESEELMTVINKNPTHAAVILAEMVREHEKENIELNTMVEWLNCQLESKINTYSNRLFRNEIISFLKDGKVIDAVRFHRNMKKSSLKDALTYVNKIRLEVVLGIHGNFNIKQHEVFMSQRGLL